jgi:uncharacterized protein (DUF1015 family)
VTPPYDVISPEDRGRRAAGHAHNFVHLILPEPAGELDRYERAAQLFRSWCREGVLVRDPRPALTVHRQTYALESAGRLTRTGVIGVLSVTGDGELQIRPHERTLPGPRRDRQKLMHSVGAHLSPIFVLAPDKNGDLQGLLDEAPGPWIAFTDEDGVDHETAIQIEPGWNARLAALLQDRELIIADGHHRFESALANYRQEAATSGPGAPKTRESGRILVEVVSLASPGLTVLPTHRLVRGLEEFEPAAFLDRLQRRARVQPLPDRGPASVAGLLTHLERAGVGTFGLILSGDGPAYLAQVAPPGGTDSPLEALDVVLLQRAILEETLGVDARRMEAGEVVTFVRDAHEAARQVSRREAQIAFLLRPTPLDALRRVTGEGLRMPQKSTFFYPKVPSGLVIHSF